MCAKDTKIIRSDKIINALIIVVTVGCVLFSLPLLAILGVLYFLYIYDNTDSKVARYGIYLFLAFLMGYLNTSKPVDYSDIGYYYWLYNFTGTKSLSEFFELIPKEPLFHIYTYLMYYLTFGVFNIYLIATTMIMYMLIFISYDIVCRNNDIDLRYAMVACVVMLFFSEFFFYTSQIVRQVLAGSVAMYGITKTTFERNRISVWLIALSGLIHASAFFFSIYYVVYFFRKYQLKYLITATVLAVVFYGVLLSVLGGFTDAESTLGIAMRRGVSIHIEQVHVGLFPLLICFLVIPLSAYIIYAYRITNINLWLIMPILLMVFILVNLNKQLFVLRFMEYIYMYIPIVLTLTIVRITKERAQLVLDLVMVVIAARFALKLGSSNFSYMDISDFAASGLPVCLFNIF